MKTLSFGLSVILFLAVAGGTALHAQTVIPESTPDNPPIMPISNEISFYKNVDDDGIDRGTTLQIISINLFHVGTDFIVEFTGDFNWDMDVFDEYDYDYYIEFSLVKPVYKTLSLNYQRIYGTFASGPVNQFGIRLSLFSGS
jgi:hypothetical protein